MSTLEAQILEIPYFSPRIKLLLTHFELVSTEYEALLLLSFLSEQPKNELETSLGYFLIKAKDRGYVLPSESLVLDHKGVYHVASPRVRRRKRAILIE